MPDAENTASRPISRPSVVSLMVQPRQADQDLSTATGFVVVDRERPYLITNWHVLTGRDRSTRQPLDANARLPDRIGVMHHVKGALGTWRPRYEPLYDGAGRGLWLEHPSHPEGVVDAVALPLTQLNEVELHTYDVRTAGDPMGVAPGTPVSIIGFPFGLRAHGFLAVWVQGFMATEHSIDYLDLPLFLVDARTRPGQSGSPVIRFSKGGAVVMEDGGTRIAGEMTRFLGVYSGRVNAESDLGFVWKTQAIVEILDGQLQTTTSLP